MHCLARHATARAGSTPLCTAKLNVTARSLHSVPIVEPQRDFSSIKISASSPFGKWLTDATNFKFIASKSSNLDCRLFGSRFLICCRRRLRHWRVAKNRGSTNPGKSLLSARPLLLECRCPPTTLAAALHSHEQTNPAAPCVQTFRSWVRSDKAARSSRRRRQVSHYGGPRGAAISCGGCSPGNGAGTLPRVAIKRISTRPRTQ
jgi:hypothetical protein